MSKPNLTITKALLASLMDVDPKTIERLVKDGKLPKPSRPFPIEWTNRTELAAALAKLPSAMARMASAIIERAAGMDEKAAA
jgi:hypothetical protein